MGAQNQAQADQNNRQDPQDSASNCQTCKDNTQSLVKTYCASAILMPIILFIVIYLLPILLPSSAMPHTFFQPSATGFNLNQNQIYLNTIPFSKSYTTSDYQSANPIPNTAAFLADVGPDHNFQHFNWDSQVKLSIITVVGLGILLLGIGLLQEWAKGQEFKDISTCCNSIDTNQQKIDEEVLKARRPFRGVKLVIVSGLLLLLAGAIYRGVAVIQAPEIERNAETYNESIVGFQKFYVTVQNASSLNALSPPYYLALDPQTVKNDTNITMDMDPSLNYFLYSVLQALFTDEYVQAMKTANYMNQVYGCHFGSGFVKFSNRWSANSSIRCLEDAKTWMASKQTVENRQLIIYFAVMVGVVIFMFFLQCQWCRPKEDQYKTGRQQTTKCEKCLKCMAFVVQFLLCYCGLTRFPKKNKLQNEEEINLLEDHVHLQEQPNDHRMIAQQ